MTTSKQLFVETLHGGVGERPPVWIMRQAGRYIPEYRELKAQHGFLGLVKDPELAAEVSMQPLRRFPLDAAILFSDILIVPEAMGQPYFFRDAGGIEMEFKVDGASAVDRLDADPTAVRERLPYIPAALERLRVLLGPDKAMLGFVGSPWTLAGFMTEGGSAASYPALRRLRLSEPAAFEALMEKLTQAVIELCRIKIAAGVDAIQIFDSLGAQCPAERYADDSLRWIRRIIAALPDDFPVILFGKNLAHRGGELRETGARALSLDWSVPLDDFRRAWPGDYALQGNLDPVLMETEPALVRQETRALIERMQGNGPHIVNLGHGITPQAKIECVEALVNEVVESGTR